MRIKLLDPEAKIPKRANSTDAGADLYSCEDVILNPHERKLIKTGIALEIPDGYYGRIEPRSGLAYKHGIDVLAGVIDSDYRGELGVVLYNTDLKNPLNIQKGDRIAQIIFEKHYNFNFEISEELSNTFRGDGGFGHTGN